MKNKTFMCLCVACIRECLSRERRPLQPCRFSKAELACAQLVVAGTELTRAARDSWSRSRPPLARCLLLLLPAEEDAWAWPRRARLPCPVPPLLIFFPAFLAWMPYITRLSSNAIWRSSFAAGIFVPYDSNPCTPQPDSMHVSSGCTTLLLPSYTRLGGWEQAVLPSSCEETVPPLFSFFY
jgi:hypothetical protein